MTTHAHRAPLTPASPLSLDVNAVVSHNLRAIRQRRGMTQEAVADHLAQLTGHRLPPASISAMERGFNGKRRRRFDAHELYLLAVVFDVPIAYFLTPPATIKDAQLAGTRRSVTDLYRALLGTDDQLPAVDQRLAEIETDNPGATDTGPAASDGPDEGARNGFRTWRNRRLRQIERQYDDRLGELADYLAEFASQIKARPPGDDHRPSPTPGSVPPPATAPSPDQIHRPKT